MVDPFTGENYTRYIFFKLRPRLSTLKKIMNGAGPPHVSSLFHLENQQFFFLLEKIKNRIKAF